MSNGKAQVDLLFLVDVIALHAMDMCPKYSLLDTGLFRDSFSYAGRLSLFVDCDFRQAKMYSDG